MKNAFVEYNDIHEFMYIRLFQRYTTMQLQNGMPSKIMF
jgi:hypothetical protein